MFLDLGGGGAKKYYFGNNFFCSIGIQGIIDVN